MAIQGNLDPAVLLTDPATIRAAVTELLESIDRPGHILNLGHGIDRNTPPIARLSVRGGCQGVTT